MYHGCVMDERQVLHVDAEVAPVSGENILALLRQLQRIKDLLCAVSAGAEHVGVVCLKYFGVCMSLGGGDIRDAVQNLLKQCKERFHLLTGAGNIHLHLVDEGLDPRRHGHIHGRTVRIF